MADFTTGAQLTVSTPPPHTTGCLYMYNVVEQNFAAISAIMLVVFYHNLEICTTQRFMTF